MSFSSCKEHGQILRSRYLYLCLVCILVISPSLNAARLLFVDGSYTGVSDGSAQRPFRTIQSAVDAADNEDTVRVAAGEYAEHVTVRNRSVRIRGVSAAVVSLVSPDTMPAISFHDVREAEVSGLTVRHLSGIGDGLYVRHSAVLVHRNVFEDDQVAVHAEDKAYGVIIEHNVFRSNDSAIVLDDVAGTIENNLFNAHTGTVIAVRNSAPVHIRNNIISGAGDLAIDVRDSTVNILNNTIVSGQKGIGLDLDDKSSARVFGNIIAFNRSYALQRTVKSRSVSSVRHNDIFGNGLDLDDQALRSTNISVDPLFENSTHPDNKGLQLRQGSPCKDYQARTSYGRQFRNDLGFSGDADRW